MTTGRPPRIAAWLLDRFATGPATDALAGDLFEEFQRRQSAAWYWRQVVRAILASAIARIRAHPVLALRAMAFGWMIVFLSLAPSAYLRTSLKPLEELGLFDVRGTDVLEIWDRVVPVQYLITFVVAGWLTARWHRPLGIASAGAFALSCGLLQTSTVIRTTSRLAYAGVPSWFVLMVVLMLTAPPALFLVGVMIGTSKDKPVPPTPLGLGEPAPPQVIR